MQRNELSGISEKFTSRRHLPHVNFPVEKHRHSGGAETVKPAVGNRKSGEMGTAPHEWFYWLSSALYLVNL